MWRKKLDGTCRKGNDGCEHSRFNEKDDGLAAHEIEQQHAKQHGRKAHATQSARTLLGQGGQHTGHALGKEEIDGTLQSEGQSERGQKELPINVHFLR